MVDLRRADRIGVSMRHLGISTNHSTTIVSPTARVEHNLVHSDSISPHPARLQASLKLSLRLSRSLASIGNFLFSYSFDPSPVYLMLRDTRAYKKADPF